MWICLNDAFLSIVDSKAADTGKRNTAPSHDDILVVRARVKGDIERVFGTDVRVQSLKGRDYLFRAFITREEVMNAIAAELIMLDYGNFKDSVPEQDRHDAYAGFWSIMYRFQSDRAANGHKPVRQQRWQDRLGAY